MDSAPAIVVSVEVSSAKYPILIQPGIIGKIGQQLPFGLPRRDAVIITDSNTGLIYAEAVNRAIEREFREIWVLSIPAGEESKSLEIAHSIWSQLVEFGSDRTTVLFALGGGVVGDIAGFVAATYMRGLPLIQIPTTLLAQVDSSVGGKTGINLPDAKNIVGAFLQPRAVFIDTDCLVTLPEREFVSGLAEVVKYGVIRDEPFFCWLESNAGAVLARDPGIMSELVKRSCHNKAEVVREDEYETSGARALLNYGHTFGHGIEAACGYGRWLHGEAVSMGMNSAAWLAMERGMFDRAAFERQRRLLQRFGLPVGLTDPDIDRILAAMKKDKKRDGALPRLILPRSIGSVEMCEWPGDDWVGRALFHAMQGDVA